MPKLPLALALCLSFLGACAQIEGLGQGTGASVRVLDGIIVPAPKGYCLSPAASDLAAGFAVFAPCTQGGEALVTVQFGAPNSAIVAGQEAEIVSFLQSPEGRASLSSRGQSSDIRIEAVSARAGAVEIDYLDRLRGGTAALSQRSWRTLFDTRARSVTISVRTLEARALTGHAATNLLSSLRKSIIAANS